MQLFEDMGPSLLITARTRFRARLPLCYNWLALLSTTRKTISAKLPVLL